jgi:hypothetical protein
MRFAFFVLSLGADTKRARTQRAAACLLIEFGIDLRLLFKYLFN